MPNITQLTTITGITNTTTFVVINNGLTRRYSYQELQNKISTPVNGIPAGGTTNQYLKKVSNTNYNTAWTTATLSDLGITDGTNGQVLTTDGSGTFTFTTSSSSAGKLDELTDVVITGIPSDGHVLKYDTVTSMWVNGTGGETYTLNTATESVLGGVKIGTGISITSDGTISAGASGGTTLPSQSGNSGKYLTTNGSALSWATVASGGFTRTEHVAITGSLYSGTTGTTFFAGFKSYVLLKISTSVGAWVRLYTTSDARSNDSSRAQTADPTPGSGVIAEVITSGEQTILMTPGVFGFNDDTTTTSTIYAAVTNLTVGQQAVTVTLTLLQLEV